MRFVINNSSNNQYYFVIKADNGEVIVTSETYYAKQSAKHTIDVIRNGASSADVIDISN